MSFDLPKGDTGNSEAALAQHIKAGDRRAFKELYEQYHCRLYGFALTFVKSEALAEEAVQEVFLRVWEHRKGLEPDRSLRSYLFSICKNYLVNVLERAGREEALREEVLRGVPKGSSGPDEEVISAEYEAVARRAVKSLPPRRREVFEKCRHEGQSYREVASTLGISTGTVSDHMVKAHKHLKQYLARHTDLAFVLLIAVASALSLGAGTGSGLVA